MPELPEVEHVKQTINRELKNLKIERVEVLYAGVLKKTIRS